MPRLSGQVKPSVPSTAPLALRLPAEVYALDGIDEERCVTGPEIHPPGRTHYHKVKCVTSYDQGHRHQLGAFENFPGGKTGMLVAAVGAIGVLWFLAKGK